MAAREGGGGGWGVLKCFYNFFYSSWSKVFVTKGPKFYPEVHFSITKGPDLQGFIRKSVAQLTFTSNYPLCYFVCESSDFAAAIPMLAFVNCTVIVKNKNKTKNTKNKF